MSWPSPLPPVGEPEPVPEPEPEPAPVELLDEEGQFDRSTELAS